MCVCVCVSVCLGQGNGRVDEEIFTTNFSNFFLEVSVSVCLCVWARVMEERMRRIFTTNFFNIFFGEVCVYVFMFVQKRD